MHSCWALFVPFCLVKKGTEEELRGPRRTAQRYIIFYREIAIILQYFCIAYLIIIESRVLFIQIEVS